MFRSCLVLVFLFLAFLSNAQSPEEDNTANDSLKKIEFVKQLGNGYFPTKYINLDLRYLIKFNQYEGIRTGLGWTTNKTFSERMKLNSYLVYGFRDHTFKYSFGAGFRISKNTNSWLNISYTDDLQETGNTVFLTDKRFFQFFEPRLLNIDLFHRHITSTLSLEYQISPNILSETQFAVSNIHPTYNYEFTIDDGIFKEFELSIATLSLQWSPFSDFELTEFGTIETRSGYPKFTLQYTKSFSDVIKGDFNFSKIDFRTIHNITHKNKALSEFTLTSGIASGNTPLTHLYHVYPNNINKETIMNRFSVAGVTSFETMFFNEFFSDRFATLQFKHYIKPFQISEYFKPQLVLISRYAIGNINNIQRHQNVTFNTLQKGYTESGFEINKLLFGFGLSFTYRYGAYHLPKFEDNIAFKFTFNITL